MYKMYKTQSPDTDPRVDKALCELAARMPAAEKLAVVGRMWRLQVQLAEMGIKSRYPSADAQERRKRLCALLHGRAISLKVYGWDPEREGY